MIFHEGQYYTPAAARERGIAATQPAAPEAAPVPAKKHLRITKSVEERMNQLERRFWAFLKKHPDRFIVPMAQPLALRLGNDVRYNPDFSALMDFGQGVQFCLFETKGIFAFEDAKVKLKVAASMFPWWPLFIVTQMPGESDFHIQRVQP